MRLSGAILLLLSACATWAYINTDIVYMGFSGKTYSRIWNDQSGRTGLQSLVANGATGLDLWRTSSTTPALDALSELTVHRTNEWQDGGRMERFSMSAMATPYGDAAYRFGVEAAGGGQLRGIIFCFEATGGPAGGATCPLKITPQGVFASSNGGAEWHQL
jgi:hypothetical protein